MGKVIRRVLFVAGILLLFASVALFVAHRIFGGIGPDGIEYGFWMEGSAVFLSIGALFVGVLYLVVRLVQTFSIQEQ